jgi:hypothetical protein
VVGGGGDSCRPTVHLGATCLRRRREKIADLATSIGPREPRSPPPHHHTYPTCLFAAPCPTCVPETAHPAASVRPIACRSGHRPLGTSAAPRSSLARGQKVKARRGRWRQQTPESQHDPPPQSPIYLRYLAQSASDRARRSGGGRTYHVPPRRRDSKGLGSPQCGGSTGTPPSAHMVSRCA